MSDARSAQEWQHLQSFSWWYLHLHIASENSWKMKKFKLTNVFRMINVKRHRVLGQGYFFLICANNLLGSSKSK